MSDLIDRQKAYEVLTEYYHHRTETQHDALREALRKLPSAEPERTAKVIDKSVGRHSIFDFDWIGKCEKCGNEIQYAFDYCPYCGSKLDWSENE